MNRVIAGEPVDLCSSSNRIRLVKFALIQVRAFFVVRKAVFGKYYQDCTAVEGNGRVVEECIY